MTIKWSGFPAAAALTASDVLVGLTGGTANGRFLGSSVLKAASNLSEVASKVTSFDNISPLTTKGDLLWYDGTHNNRIAIGSLNQILAVGASNTVGWIANPGLLIANNLSDLASVPAALTSLGLDSASDVTFNSIVSTTSLTAATVVANTSATAPSFISTGLNVVSNISAVTAHAGGGQASATALTKAINRVNVVATAGDSVKLPAGTVGYSVVVINMGANALDCFPASGGAINSLPNDTALSIAVGSTVQFFCAVNLKWNAIVSA